MGGLEFDDVSFGYSLQTPILDGFTLTVDAGHQQAFIDEQASQCG